MKNVRGDIFHVMPWTSRVLPLDLASAGPASRQAGALRITIPASAKALDGFRLCRRHHGRACGGVCRLVHQGGSGDASRQSPGPGPMHPTHILLAGGHANVERALFVLVPAGGLEDAGCIGARRGPIAADASCLKNSISPDKQNESRRRGRQSYARRDRRTGGRRDNPRARRGPTHARTKRTTPAAKERRKTKKGPAFMSLRDDKAAKFETIFQIKGAREGGGSGRSGQRPRHPRPNPPSSAVMA